MTNRKGWPMANKGLGHSDVAFFISAGRVLVPDKTHNLVYAGSIPAPASIDLHPLAKRR